MECQICLESILNPYKVIRPTDCKCIVTLHESCYKMWLKQTNTYNKCIICKKSDQPYIVEIDRDKMIYGGSMSILFCCLYLLYYHTKITMCLYLLACFTAVYQKTMKNVLLVRFRVNVQETFITLRLD